MKVGDVLWPAPSRLEAAEDWPYTRLFVVGRQMYRNGERYLLLWYDTQTHRVERGWFTGNIGTDTAWAVMP